MEKQSLGMRVRALRGEARREAITRVVAEYESSGLSAVAFCRSAGIAAVTLARWRRELRGKDRRTTEPRFVEVRAPRPAHAATFDVELPGDVTVRVPPGFDAADLERLLAIVRPTC